LSHWREAVSDHLAAELSQEYAATLAKVLDVLDQDVAQLL
jgi:hypothetical protein